MSRRWFFTVLLEMAELLAAMGSPSAAVTLAVLLNGPATLALTTRATVAVAPLFSGPRLQLTVEVPVHDP